MSEASKYSLPAGIVLVCSDDGELVAVVTDGDVRRGLLAGVNLDDPVARIMREDPIVFPEDTPYRSILRQIPFIIRERGRYRGGVVEKIIFVDSKRRPTRVLNFFDLWQHNVTEHRHVVVVGMGYVGLTLAIVLAELGYRVTGIEHNPAIRDALLEGNPHFHEPGLKTALSGLLNKSLFVEDEAPHDGDIFVISVGTPLDSELRPNLEHVSSAAREVGARLKESSLVILRSTVPVGTTREVVVPLLEEASGLEAGSDFYVAFAPERTVEGDALRELRELPQIVGGLTPNCQDLTSALFANVTPVVVRVDSLEEAELAKIVNNGFRDMSFAFANEIALICKHFNIDSHSLVQAANQGYRRNPIPSPSPGVGGACLNKDPYIMAEAARRVGLEQPLSLSGRRLNESMPTMVAHWAKEALAKAGKDVGDSIIFLAGMAFKGQPETSDMRGSTSLEIAKLFAEDCRELRVHDPVVERDQLESLGYRPVSVEEGFNGADLVMLLTNHVEYSRLELRPLLESLARPAVFVDAWGVHDPDIVLTVDGIIYQRLGSIA
jgi:UDP-N-acetyl-D-mannosaminuronic acid dehydrogenase